MLIKHPTCYGNPIISGDMNTITIGKYCSIANSAMFDGGAQHNHHYVTTYPLWKIGAEENKNGMCHGDIRVGNDVWIGDGALIMSGIQIGDGAVIGARAVVTRSVPPYEVWAGVPAAKRGYRFEPEIAEKIHRVAWWDWPEEKILENADLLMSTDMRTFLEKHGAQ